MFKWSRAQVEELFVRIHSIAPHRTDAFRARLRHLQRLGVPPGTNTGKGRPATYGPKQTTLLGVALELLQLGLTPEHACSSVLENLTELEAALSHGAAGAFAATYTGGHQLLLINPGGLSALQIQGEHPNMFVAIGPSNQLGEFIADPPRGYAGHLAIIDLRWLIQSICEAAAAFGLGKADQLSWAVLRMNVKEDEHGDPQA